QPLPPRVAPLSLHDALPIWQFAIHDGALVVHWTLARASRLSLVLTAAGGGGPLLRPPGRCLHAVGALGNPRGTQIKPGPWAVGVDRKSTRLNSSHVKISYAV